MKYSIITFNFNNYQILREIDEKSNNCQYIYITDNDNLKSNTWNIVLQNDKLKKFTNVFEKCFYIRYHLFEFCNTQYCICLDGSIKIHKNLDVLMNAFINSNCDVGLMNHPSRSNVESQLLAWIDLRDYAPALAFNQIQLKSLLNNYNDNKLYQMGMRICKNTKYNQALDEMTYSFLKLLGHYNNEQIERQDQTVYTMIINHFFQDMKIFNFTQDIIQSSYMTLCVHNTNQPIEKMYLPKLDNYYYIE